MNGCSGNCKCKGGAVANRAAIFLRKARAVARKCAAAGVPSPFTVNTRGRLTINPAVSEAQRRFLNSQFGHDWVKEHDFDNHGQLPERVSAENERRMGAADTCTANESSFFGRFWKWMTSNSNPDGHNQYTGSAADMRDKAFADKKSATADEKSKAANDSRSHEKAADAHDKAHVAHKEAAMATSDKKFEKYHTDMAAYHDKKGDSHRELVGNRRITTNDPAVSMRTGVAQPVLRQRDPAGRFGAGAAPPSSEVDREGDEASRMAEERGWSEDEARAHLDEPKPGGKKVTKNRRHLVANAHHDDEECPECGGQMEEDEEGDMRCKECGYVENANPIGDQDNDADDRTGTPEGGDARSDGRHNKKLTRQKPIDVIDDDGDPYLDEDDHSDLARDDQIRATQNAFPPKRYDGPDPHDATKQAAASTVMTEHDDAQKPAMAAIKQSSAGDSDEAADSHDEAAEAHEDAATQARTDGDHMGASDHDQAAAMHRKAASMHKSNMTFNQRYTENTWSDAAREASIAARRAGAKSISVQKSAHRDAANAHRQAATEAKESSHVAKAREHRDQAQMHEATVKSLSKRITGNQSGHTMTRNQWIKLFMNDPVLATNMPAGGAFSGAKGAGYSAAQAAAMAGKLEGSYGSSGGVKGTPGKGAVAKQASEHAEKTKSKSAHQKAASAHKEAAKEHMEKSNEHEDAGNKKWAQHHEAMSSVHATAARSHAAKAARMTRNERLRDLIENCTCPETAHGLRQLITNEPDAIGGKGDEIYAGRQEDDDEPALGDDDDNDLSEKVKPKKNKMATNEYLSTLPAELRETLTEAAAITNRDKQRIVTRLTANIRNPTRREFRISELMGRSLKDLRGMLELVGNAQPAQEEQRQAGGDYLPLYGPGNVTFTDNAGGDGDDVLDCPTLNFAPPARTA